VGNEITIYKLIDPRNISVKYIGWTHNSLQKRLIDHLSEARRGQRNHRCNWIRKLLSENLLPSIEPVESVAYNKRGEKEKYWISYYGRENLVNGTDGGEGVVGLIVSEESRKKSSLSHLGQIPWNKGISIPNLHLKKFQFKKGLAPWNKGIQWSPEITQKVSESKAGKSTGKRKTTKSVCFGITYNKLSDIWISQITFMKKHYFIGRYDSENNAGTAYDICSLWFSTKNRKLNFPNKKEEYMILLSSHKTENMEELRKMIRNYIKVGGDINDYA